MLEASKVLIAMNDHDIRHVFLSDLDKKYADDADTIIIEELGLCQGEARVDIAVVNSSIYGFEIKSDQDTLRRLPRQIEIYGKSLDFVTLVVGKRHLDKSIKLIPKWWGVTIAGKNGNKITLKKRRNGRINPCLDTSSVVQLLWRNEAFEALKKRNLHRGLTSKPRSILWAKLVENLSSDELLSLTRNTLKSRTNWRSVPQQM